MTHLQSRRVRVIDSHPGGEPTRLAVTGGPDLAEEGNWFFPMRDSSREPSLENIEQRGDFTGAIRKALCERGNTGANQEIDHIEWFGQSDLPAVDSNNFVLGPGKAYDRCARGTGTSAKRACLEADGKIREGQISQQESIVGSVLDGSITASGGPVYPSIKGTAFVDPQDPFCMGIRG